MKLIEKTNKIDDFINDKKLIELNDTLSQISIDLIFKELNVISVDDFKLIKNKKIKNKFLEKIINGNLIENKVDYIKNKIIYEKSFDFNSDNELFHSLINKKNVQLVIKSKKLMTDIFSDKFNEFINDYKNNITISYNGYKFNKDCFSEEFNTRFIDYKDNYELYLKNPRIGKEKLEIEKNKIINIEKDISNALLLDFTNFYIEIET